MGAADHRGEGRIQRFDRFEGFKGMIDGHGHGCDTDQIRFEIPQHRCQIFPAIGKDDAIQEFDRVPGLLQCTGQESQSQGRRRGFGNRVKGVDQQYAQG